MQRSIVNYIQQHKRIFSIGLAFILGIVLTVSIQKVLADNNTISACVDKKSGVVRIITGSQTCTSKETPISWSIQGLAGPQGIQGPPGPAGSGGNSGLPFICPGCNMEGNIGSDGKSFIANLFTGKDLSGSYLPGVGFTVVQGIPTDLTNTKFVNAVLTQSGFLGVTATGADFSGAHLQASTFASSNLTNANFKGADISSMIIDVGGGNFQTNSSLFTDTNLTNVNFTNANLKDAIDMNTATLTGIIWSNTTCPDGSNSDNDGNTCVGHF